MKIDTLFENNTRESKKVTPEDYFKYHRDLQTAITAYNQGRVIYRGVHFYDGNMFYQPMMASGARPSSGTKNYYVLITDNVPEWQSFPTRSSSIIATTDADHAQDYGLGFVVLPFGDPVIAQCPAEDFWYSFSSLEKLEMESLEDLAYALDDLTALYGLNTLDQNNWQNFQKGLDQLTEAIRSNRRVPQMEYAYSLQNLVTKRVSLLDAMRKLLNPQPARFTLSRLSTWQPEPHREIWFTAAAMFIEGGGLEAAPGKNLDEKMKYLLNNQ